MLFFIAAMLLLRALLCAVGSAFAIQVDFPFDLTRISFRRGFTLAEAAQRFHHATRTHVVIRMQLEIGSHHDATRSFIFSVFSPFSFFTLSSFHQRRRRLDAAIRSDCACLCVFWLHKNCIVSRRRKTGFVSDAFRAKSKRCSSGNGFLLRHRHLAFSSEISSCTSCVLAMIYECK